MRTFFAAPHAPSAARERLVSLLDAMTYGLMPGDGSEPSPETCATITALSAGIGAIETSHTATEALAAFTGCLLHLAGAGIQVTVAAVTAVVAAQDDPAWHATAAEGNTR